jgi:hypothetical protein
LDPWRLALAMLTSKLERGERLETAHLKNYSLNGCTSFVDHDEDFPQIKVFKMSQKVLVLKDSQEPSSLLSQKPGNV